MAKLVGWNHLNLLWLEVFCFYGFKFVDLFFRTTPSNSRQRVPNPPILWRSPYIASPLPLFFKFYLTPSPPALFLLPCYFGWMCDHARWASVLFYFNEPCYQQHLPACFMQQGIRFTESLREMICFSLVP